MAGRWPERAARPFGLVAALLLAFMMVFTSVAVVMRQVFDAPVLGVVDVMELALVIMVFVALPGVFLRDDNITVDVIDQIVPRQISTALRGVALLLALIWLALMMVEMWPQAMDKWTYGEQTMTLGINRFVHWLPILFGFAASIAACAVLLVARLRRGGG